MTCKMTTIDDDHCMHVLFFGKWLKIISLENFILLYFQKTTLSSLAHTLTHFENLILYFIIYRAFNDSYNIIIIINNYSILNDGCDEWNETWTSHLLISSLNVFISIAFHYCLQICILIGFMLFVFFSCPEEYYI